MAPGKSEGHVEKKGKQSADCERVMRGSKAIALGIEECRQVIPEHLLEKIISMVSFPFLLEARRLSKAWLAKFSPISSQDDKEGKRSIAVAFQKQVGEWSKNWGTFCPILLTDGVYIAYNRESNSWPKISLSFLPKVLLELSDLEIEGPLLSGLGRTVAARGMGHLYVANILTASWKLLPPRPKEDWNSVFCHKLVNVTDLETYKVILVCHKDSVSDPLNSRPQHVYLHIYDSKADTWSSKKHIVSKYFFSDAQSIQTTSAYFEGVLYIANINDLWILLAFHVQTGTKAYHSIWINYLINHVSLVVCNVNLLMVLAESRTRTLHVLKINPGSRPLLTEVAQYPIGSENKGMRYFRAVSDGTRIFIGMEKSGRRVLTYNVEENLWSWLDVPPTPKGDYSYKWIGSCLQPSLSPFVNV